MRSTYRMLFAATLRRHRQASPFRVPDDFIFCKADGRAGDPDYLRNFVLYPAMDRAGIERKPRTHGFHLFRHTAPSIVHEKTGSLKQAQKLLGHAGLDTTANIYVHVDEGQAREAAEVVSDALLASCPLFAHPEGKHEESTR